MIQTPTCDKWAACHDRFIAIKDFLESADEHKAFLCTSVMWPGWTVQDIRALATSEIDAMLYAHFEIDTKQLEAERRAILAEQRRQNEQNEKGAKP